MSRVRVPDGVPNENRNFDTKLRFCFLSENPVIKGFLQKEKFLCNKCRDKIGAFSVGLYTHCSLRNFSSKDNAPLSFVF